MTLLTIILATCLIGLVSLLGILFVISKMDVHKLTFYLISLASGTMVGTALLHLIPESLETNPRLALLGVGSGVFLFFILEKFLIWRHCHLHQHSEDHAPRTTANMVLFGDAVHNFIDGMVVASSFMASRTVGISVTMAIILHEIPQELGDFGILIHGGYPVRRALLANGLIALTAVLGAVLTYFFLESLPMLQPFLLPITAGGFLYISLADLIPELHSQTTLRQTLTQIALLLGGFILTYLLKG